MSEQTQIADDVTLDPQGADDLYNALRAGTYLGPVEGKDDYLIFSLDGSQRALVPVEEFSRHTPATGDSVSLLIERPLGRDQWLASWRKADKIEAWDGLITGAVEGREVEGMVLGVVSGGFAVDIGVRAFVPFSQMDLHRIEDPSAYIGRVETFSLMEFDQRRAMPVLTRRKILEAQRVELRQSMLDNLAVGQIFEGVVRRIEPYGAFVDIGGVEGLLHVSNMSWGRVDRADELVRQGDTVRVQVIELKEVKGKRKIALGRKQLMDDPWANIHDRFADGQLVSGKVVSLAEFGAFVELEPGLEGLIHVTELSWTTRVQHPREILAIGQTVGVKIIGVDTERRRLALSVKQLEQNPWEALGERIKQGDKIAGTVRRIVDFGVFVEVAPAIEGLVHTSNVSWTERNIQLDKLFSIGQQVEVVVLEVDLDAQRMDLGVKQLSEDPWEAAARIAKPNSRIEVEVTRISPKLGAFVQIAEGVEGLIHISELSNERVEDVQSVVRPGQTVQALVLSFDRENRRIGLSLKREQVEDGELSSYEDQGAAGTLGDILRERLGQLSDDPGQAGGEGK
jgi:small subunit ribosomal protein S1